MPYQHEFAKNGPNQRLMSSGIKDMLKVIRFVVTDIEYERLDNYVVEAHEPARLKYAFIFDGSKFENDPTIDSHASFGIFNFNQCVVDIEKNVAYLKEKFPLPKMYREIKDDVTLNLSLPLKGMRTVEHDNERDFFRFVLFDMLQKLNNPMVQWLKDKGYPIKFEETIYDTYMSLTKSVEYVKDLPNPCPVCRRAGKTISVKMFKDENKKWSDTTLCRCETNPTTVYTTDLLGFQEQLNTEHGNGSLTSQIMLVIERVILLNFIRLLTKNDLKDLINDSIMIMDGTLAIYSHASWLSEAINQEIANIKYDYPILLIGVEKTGNFVDHFKRVNEHYHNQPLKNGMLFFLEDKYIKSMVKENSMGYYGEKTYFGKKMFYKNKKGKMFVINVAFEHERDRCVDYDDRNTQAYRDSVTRLKDIVMILDNFSSQSFDNALSLISFANDGVALSSSKLAKKSLNDFIQDIMKE